MRKLSDQEVNILNKKKKSSISFTRDRARIILASDQNYSCKQISRKLGFGIKKIRAAIKAFNSKDLQCLERGKAKGAVPKFMETTKKVILMHFAKPPLNLGYTFTAWTLPRFKKHLVENKIVESISIETLRQIIYNSGAKLEKSKRWQYSPDPDFHKKNLQ